MREAPSILGVAGTTALPDLAVPAACSALAAIVPRWKKKKNMTVQRGCLHEKNTVRDTYENVGAPQEERGTSGIEETQKRKCRLALDSLQARSR